jgi:Fe-S-cluster containining protein
MSTSDKTPWFRDGLKFQCSQCGDCCTGAPGFVWVNQEEIDGLARRLQMDSSAFEAKYVRRVGIRRSLIEYDDGACVFFDTEKRNCTVYEDRPRQCKTWPFWSSNVRTPETWADTCEACPGCGKGKLHPLEQILVQVDVMRI